MDYRRAVLKLPSQAACKYCLYVGVSNGLREREAKALVSLARETRSLQVNGVRDKRVVK